ncbi:hypothetical protein [Pedobacter sp. SL55]|uniref:hypothetical protein n=1 Tax=Pedobacter sp. SL55 TaxID=2995161 RepID=UPI0022701621|nr:hypothetical protein [Pedobacter sp. SL55]WAC41491.1 hypothetical protein OVA16_03765 [Pedobacter sp. SL55]
MHIINDKQLETSAIIFIYQTRVFSQIIYITTLVAIATLLVSLPFIHTTVSVKSVGMMQSNIEKIELFAPVSGKITKHSLVDNSKALKGELLLSIDENLPRQQEVIANHRKIELTNWLSDANKAINHINAMQCNLTTGLYTASWQQFNEQRATALSAQKQAFKIFDRYQTLYQKKVVTLAEYEEHKFNLEQRTSELEMVTKRYKTQWQTEAKQYRQELSELHNHEAQLKEQKSLYQLVSPINGFIQNPTGLQVGSFVQANQKICEIYRTARSLRFATSNHQILA